ncbi:hypothetical protein [Photorhabdus khanii]|uniref:hypothetical protein n=1 Tax=Photorhabdus khanii TaxID=1004150 RepID=UPI001EFF9ADB|nr:hypothetical protein [Photorhabdus khanii]
MLKAVILLSDMTAHGGKVITAMSNRLTTVFLLQVKEIGLNVPNVKGFFLS